MNRLHAATSIIAYLGRGSIFAATTTASSFHPAISIGQVPGANSSFADHARRYLESLVERNGFTLEAKVRELVRVQLSSGRCTVDRLAQQIGCDRRTLHRRLALEQVTFDAILNSVRGELAVRLLQNRQAGLTDTADMLGFSSGSAFSRWFLGAFGKRPSEWRKELDTVERHLHTGT